jgi:murein DD-endopeptidase MepM/ murein hydrolase activator NlpD
MKTKRHSQHGRVGRHAVRLLIGATAIALGGYAYVASKPDSHALAAGNTSQPTAPTHKRAYSYGWPVKPFDRQHPVRGNLGDPRTIFAGPPTRRGLFLSDGAFSFHQGIDISAPDGTPVYPVRSGVVRIVTADWVEVDCAAGSAFQYWHIKPRVTPGQHVTEDESVLGTILKHSEHVHLTQLENGRAVNPLAPGNIGPFTDTTVPRVNDVEFRAGEGGPELLPEYVHGRVEIAVDASDTQPMPVPGLWHGLPVSPARLTFRIESLPHHRLVRAGTSMDVTRGLPASANMWSTYARGSHMNAVQMGHHRYWFQPGVYLFKLTPTPLDTRALPDGAYELKVTASDTAGNHSSRTQIFSVHNRAGWLNG